jgi:alkylhydroperoxidase family enzyme
MIVRSQQSQTQKAKANANAAKTHSSETTKSLQQKPINFHSILRRIIMSTTKFTSHTIESAPAGSKPTLEATKKGWGFVPQLHGVLSESPIALQAYDTLFGLVAKSTLTPIEQQVAYQAINVLHECEYCTAGHTYLSRSVNMPEDVIQALRNSTPIADARLQALRVFTERVVTERGFVGDAAVDAFINAGFTKENVLEVITVVATKTISNYTNHITHTPKESFMADPALAWVAPRNRKAMAKAA